LNGRYGPYITFNKSNYKIPKKLKPEELTLEDCRAIIAEEDKGKEGKAVKSKSTANDSAKKAPATKNADAKAATTKVTTTKAATALASAKASSKKAATKKLLQKLRRLVKPRRGSRQQRKQKHNIISMP